MGSAFSDRPRPPDLWRIDASGPPPSEGSIPRGDSLLQVVTSDADRAGLRERPVPEAEYQLQCTKDRSTKSNRPAPQASQITWSSMTRAGGRNQDPVSTGR